MNRSRFIPRSRVAAWRAPQVRHARKRKRVTHADYYAGMMHVAYGQPKQAEMQLGDLFNDIMGAVVGPAWDARPEALKQIVIKPDPNKLISAAQKVAPQAGSQVVNTVNKYGFNVFAKTPAGNVEITPGMAQGMYSNAQWFTSAKSAFDAIPTWALVGGGVLAVGGILYLLRK